MKAAAFRRSRARIFRAKSKRFHLSSPPGKNKSLKPSGKSDLELRRLTR